MENNKLENKLNNKLNYSKIIQINEMNSDDIQKVLLKASRSVYYKQCRISSYVYLPFTPDGYQVVNSLTTLPKGFMYLEDLLQQSWIEYYKIINKIPDITNKKLYLKLIRNLSRYLKLRGKNGYYI